MCLNMDRSFPESIPEQKILLHNVWPFSLLNANHFNSSFLTTIRQLLIKAMRLCHWREFQGLVYPYSGINHLLGPVKHLPVMCKLKVMDTMHIIGSRIKCAASKIDNCASYVHFLRQLQFLSSGFVVMLFHYDGEVDAWNDLPWSKSAIHISAVRQTKWWTVCSWT